MADQNKQNMNQQNQNQQGGVKQGQKDMGKGTGKTSGQPINNPNVRK